MGEIAKLNLADLTGLTTLERITTFPTPPSLKLPEPAAPPALPQIDTEAAKRKAARRRGGGRAETFITGDLTPSTGKRQVLG